MDRLLRRSCPGQQSFAAEFRGPGAGSEWDRARRHLFSTTTPTDGDPLGLGGPDFGPRSGF